MVSGVAKTNIYPKDDAMNKIKTFEEFNSIEEGLGLISYIKEVGRDIEENIKNLVNTSIANIKIKTYLDKSSMPLLEVMFKEDVHDVVVATYLESYTGLMKSDNKEFSNLSKEEKIKTAYEAIDDDVIDKAMEKIGLKISNKKYIEIVKDAVNFALPYSHEILNGLKVMPGKISAYKK